MTPLSNSAMVKIWSTVPWKGKSHIATPGSEGQLSVRASNTLEGICSQCYPVGYLELGQPAGSVGARMTKYDVKNYLEKIYNVPVGVIRTRIQFGSNKKRNHLNQKVKQPDYKVAYVQLFMRGKHAPTRPGRPTAPGQAQLASRPSAGTTEEKRINITDVRRKSVPELGSRVTEGSFPRDTETDKGHTELDGRGRTKGTLIGGDV
ncbi:hypothetical protein AMECASPLE_007975 [Ameca splendens]|uniref:Large ribosomal subunit protein uL23m n=1 Tax=Ameca splendens TaxID=208324 RepID=A0ABV0ZY12_9TELE